MADGVKKRKSKAKSANDFDFEEFEHTDYRLKYIDGNGAQGEPDQPFWASENKAYADLQTIKKLFFSEDWVFSTVDAVAQPISTIPIHVFRTQMVDGQEEKTKVRSDTISKIFNQPNRYQTKSHLLYCLAADYLLTGNCYAWRSESGSLYQIPAENVIYNFGKDALPSGYLVMTDSENGLPTVRHSIALNAMAHAKRPNPSSAIYGLSPFVPGRRSVLFNRYSSEYLNNFYLKGASPQWILEMAADANEKAVGKLLSSFEASYVGRRNQRRTLILPRGVSAKPSETKIADQQLKDLITMNRENILAVLKVPKHVLGLQTSGSLGSEEHKQALKYFWQTTVTDTAKAIAQSLTQVFFPNGEYSIEFDFSEIAELQDDEMQKALLSKELLNIMTPNEVRKKIWKLDAIEGGDTIASFQPKPAFNQFGLSEPEQIPEPEPVVNETKNLLTFNFNENHKKAIDKSAQETKKIEKESYAQRFSAATKLITKQIETALDVINPGSKADLNKKEIKKKLVDTFKEMESDYVNEADKDLIGTAELGYDKQVDLVFDEQAKEALAAAKEKDAKGRRKLLTDRNLFSFKSATKTNTENIMYEVERGIKESLSISDVSKNIAQYMKDNLKWRSDMMARTETLTALSVGQDSVLKQAKASGIKKMKKVWVSAADERVRSAHADAMGQTVDSDSPFIVSGEKLMYPRAPGGSAGNVINCRCDMLMIPSDEISDYDQDIENLEEQQEQNRGD
jgi:HK97 family phage portal protein